MTIWADSYNPEHLVAANAYVKDLSPTIALVLYTAFSFAVVYSITTEYIQWYRSLHARQCEDPVGAPVDVTTTTTQCNFKVIDGTRGDKQPSSTSNSIATKQSYSIKSFDDGRHLNENTFGTSGYYTASSNYSDYSYKSKIVGGGNVKPTLTRSTLHGAKSVADKGYDVHRHTVKESQEPLLQEDCHNPRFRETPYPDKPIQNEGSLAYTYTVKQKDLEAVPQKQMHGEFKTQNSNNELSKRQTERNEPVQLSQPSSLPEPKKLSTGYNKSTYAVLIGNSVKVYSTNTFASFPHNNKFLVKERHQDSTGITRVKLTLKSTESRER